MASGFDTGVDQRQLGRRQAVEFHRPVVVEHVVLVGAGRLDHDLGTQRVGRDDAGDPAVLGLGQRIVLQRIGADLPALGEIARALRVDADAVERVGVDAGGVERDRRHAAGQCAHRGQAAALRMPGDREVAGLAARGVAEHAREFDRGVDRGDAELVAVAGLVAQALAEVVVPVVGALGGAAVGQHVIAFAVGIDLGAELLRVAAHGVVGAEELQAPGLRVAHAQILQLLVADRAPAFGRIAAGAVHRGRQLRQRHVERLRPGAAGDLSQRLPRRNAVGTAGLGGLRAAGGGGTRRLQLRVVTGFGAPGAEGRLRGRRGRRLRGRRQRHARAGVGNH